MSELKWIKICIDIFDDEKIKIIENLPEGDTLLIIWFKLLVLAGKKNDSGLVYITRDIPYLDDTLATVITRSNVTVTLALQTFEKMGMIEKNNGLIAIVNWEKHQSVDKIDEIKKQNRIRQQKYRYGQKLEIGAICSYCGNKATGFDHIIAITKNGKDTKENKIPCCIDCNRQKNNHDLVYFLNELISNRNDEVIGLNKRLCEIIFFDSNTKKYSYKNNVTVTSKNNVTVTSRHAIDKNRIDKNRIDKNRIDKNSNKNPGLKKPVPPVDNDLKELKKNVSEFFREKSPQHFQCDKDYALQGKYVKDLCLRAQEINPNFDDQKAWLKSILHTFYLICSGQTGKKTLDFLKGTPYVPSQMLSKGIWTYVLQGMETIHKTINLDDVEDLP